MFGMSRRQRGEWDERISRIERALRRCLEWSRTGRHVRILAEVDRALPAIGDQPVLEAQLLIWKAQAHLAMGEADRAHPAATRSWQLDPSPHACHLLANALAAVGRADEAEELLRSGWELFPGAYHLPVQLAILLSDQGRHPEALDALDRLPRGATVPDDLQVFLLGLHANLLAAVGRWGEADGVLREGRSRHPGSDLLEDAHRSLGAAWDRFRSEEALAGSWHRGLERLDGVAREIDDTVERLGSGLELSKLAVLAARRLWRAYLEARSPRPQVIEPWAAALLAAVLEVDGLRPSTARIARIAKASASTTRSVLARLRGFLDELEPSLARRAFGAASNPQLGDGPPGPPDAEAGVVVPFPSR